MVVLISNFQSIKTNKFYISIPYEMRRKCSEYEHAFDSFAKQNKGKYPSDRYLMKVLGIDENEMIVIRDTLRSYNVSSLNEEIMDGETTITVADTIEDDEDKYMGLYIKEDKHRMFGLILKLRNPKERRVLIDEYYNTISQVDIASDMG